jgi:hypothetical protein
MRIDIFLSPIRLKRFFDGRYHSGHTERETEIAICNALVEAEQMAFLKKTIPVLAVVVRDMKPDNPELVRELYRADASFWASSQSDVGLINQIRDDEVGVIMTDDNDQPLYPVIIQMPELPKNSDCIIPGYDRRPKLNR